MYKVNMLATIKAKVQEMVSKPTGYLGLCNSIPSEVTALKNFAVIFGIQMVFSLDDLMTLGTYPTTFELIKTTLSSLAITIGFYGYNKRKAKKEAEEEEPL